MGHRCFAGTFAVQLAEGKYWEKACACLLAEGREWGRSLLLCSCTQGAGRVGGGLVVFIAPERDARGVSILCLFSVRPVVGRRALCRHRQRVRRHDVQLTNYPSLCCLHTSQKKFNYLEP